MKKKSKKIFLSLGTIGMVVAPVASAISCGTNDHVDHYKLLPTYTGQADQLIALGIKADYYPWQLEKKAPFDYLTDAGKYVSKNQPDSTFAAKFAAKVKKLIPSSQGTSWWNQQALEDGEKGSNPEYWTHKGGDLVLYEHYLLDDGAKQIDGSKAPKHNNYPSTFIQTNFRQSRDPFTRIPEDVIEGLLDLNKYNALSTEKKKVINQMLDAAREAEKTSPTEKAVDGKPRPIGELKDDIVLGDKFSWLYNDYVFAKGYHLNFLDNPTFKATSFKDLIVDAKTDWVFDKDPATNKKLAKLFYDSTYQEPEKDLKALMTDSSNAQNGTTQLNHHPIYDQQTELGAAPMFEGAQRDNSLYLYDLSSKLQAATTNQIEDEKGFNEIKKAFGGNEQWVKMTHALDNADQIQKDLKARQIKIAKLVTAIKSKNGKTPVFGVATVAPGGLGVSTIQTSSKYSFLYRDLGFAQPIPKDFSKITAATGGDGGTGNTMFNMDDNGWWWNISKQDANGESTGINSERTELFKEEFDYGALTVNDADWALDAQPKKGQLKPDDKTALNVLFKTGDSAEKHKVDYNLWNEGLKTPFVMHMILDQIVDQIKDDAITAGASQNDVNEAYGWGTYFTTTFLA